MRSAWAFALTVSLLAITGGVSSSLAEEPPAPAAVAAAPAPPAAAGDAQAGAALVARAVEGLGGAAAVDGVKRLELRGKGTRKVPNGNELPIETTTRIVYPGRYRQDINLAVGAMSTVVTEKGAFLLTGGTAMPLGEGQRALLAGALRRNLLTLFRSRNEPSFSAVKIGVANVDGTAVELVRVGIEGEPMTLAIDPATGHTLRLSSQNVSAGVGPSGELVISYSDFRKAGSLVYPYVSVGTLNGEKVYDSKLDAVVVDGPLDEALFEMPATQVPLPTEIPAAPSPAQAPVPPAKP